MPTAKSILDELQFTKLFCWKKRKFLYLNHQFRAMSYRLNYWFAYTLHKNPSWLKKASRWWCFSSCRFNFGALPDLHLGPWFGWTHQLLKFHHNQGGCHNCSFFSFVTPWLVARVLLILLKMHYVTFWTLIFSFGLWVSFLFF